MYNNLHSHTRPHFQKCQLFIGHNLESPGEEGKVSTEWSSSSVWSLSISVRNYFGCLSWCRRFLPSVWAPRWQVGSTSQVNSLLPQVPLGQSVFNTVTEIKIRPRRWRWSLMWWKKLKLHNRGSRDGMCSQHCPEVRWDTCSFIVSISTSEKASEDCQPPTLPILVIWNRVQDRASLDRERMTCCWTCELMKP